MSLIYIAAKPINGQPLADLFSLISLGLTDDEVLYGKYGDKLELRRNGPRVDLYRITPPARIGVNCGSPDCHCTRDVEDLMISFSIDAEGLQMDLGDPMPEIRLRAFNDADAARNWLASD